EGFAFPSHLPEARIGELKALAARVLPVHGFDDGFFNMELFLPLDGSPKLIEVNGRIASQFAPLVRAVQGRSTYEALFRLACAEARAWGAALPRGVAISYCLRVFDDAFVAAVPEPDAGVEILVEPGRLLSQQATTNDADSYRLAIFHEWGETRDEALDRCRA